MTAMEAAMQQPGESAGLSQVERVVDAFVAPTKTFTDIRRNASWWLPYLLLIVVSVAFAASIDHKIGFDQVAQSNINHNASAQQRMSALTDAQREQSIHTIGSVTRVISYLYPVIGLIFAFICAGILMMTFNFGLGAKASYKQYLAVWFYRQACHFSSSSYWRPLPSLPGLARSNSISTIPLAPMSAGISPRILRCGCGHSFLLRTSSPCGWSCC